MSATMQMDDVLSGTRLNSPQDLMMRTIAIASPLEINGSECPASYDTNDSARNDAYNNMQLNLLIPVQLEPPALPRIVSIPLPALSPNIPIQIHTLITYRLSTSTIYWNVSLPPVTALLAIAENALNSRSRWSRNVAVVPSVSSFTIRIRGVARPVVVFPVDAGVPIRIIDITRAVYNAIRAEALESSAGASDVLAYGSNRQGSRKGLSSDDAIAADAIRRHFRNRVWWNGLSQSMNEVDVWVLHLRGARRGRCHR